MLEKIQTPSTRTGYNMPDGTRFCPFSAKVSRSGHRRVVWLVSRACPSSVELRARLTYSCGTAPDWTGLSPSYATLPGGWRTCILIYSVVNRSVMRITLTVKPRRPARTRSHSAAAAWPRCRSGSGWVVPICMASQTVRATSSTMTAALTAASGVLPDGEHAVVLHQDGRRIADRAHDLHGRCPRRRSARSPPSGIGPPNSSQMAVSTGGMGLAHGGKGRGIVRVRVHDAVHVGPAAVDHADAWRYRRRA